MGEAALRRREGGTTGDQHLYEVQVYLNDLDPGGFLSDPTLTIQLQSEGYGRRIPAAAGHCRVLRYL